MEISSSYFRLCDIELGLDKANQVNIEFRHETGRRVPIHLRMTADQVTLRLNMYESTFRELRAAINTFGKELSLSKRKALRKE